MTAEKRARKDLDAKIMKQVDETAFALRLDLAREKKLREEAEERHEKEVAAFAGSAESEPSDAYCMSSREVFCDATLSHECCIAEDLTR